MKSFTDPLAQSDYRARLADGAPITSGDVATLPRPGTGSPSSVKFHGDDWVTYLLPEDPKSLSRKLYATNVVTEETAELFRPGGSGTEDDFSLEEKLRRERARMMATGVTSYAWAGKARRMLVPLGGALWLMDDPLGGGGGPTGGEPYKVAEMNTGETDADDFDSLPANSPLLDSKISADGSTIAFVCGDEVYVAATRVGEDGTTSKPRRVTSGARGVDGLSNGAADYVAQEELERADGFWLSPKGTRLIYESVDESRIPSYRITHQGEDRGLSPTLDSGMTSEDVREASAVTYEEHRYPFAGAQNPIVKLGVADTAGGKKEDVDWFDLTAVFGEDFYLAKVEWLPAGDDDGDDDGDGIVEESTRFVVQILDRRQKSLALVMCDTENGSMTTLHVEKAIEGGWINLNDAFRPLASDGTSLRFLWASERDGYRHLYELEADLGDGGAANSDGATVVRRLTGPGEFIVEEIVDVDKENRLVYYMGTEPDGWLDRHLFRVSLDADPERDGPPVCLTGSVPGVHSCVVRSKSGLFVDSFSSASRPPVVAVRRLSDPSNVLLRLHDAAGADPRVSALGGALRPPTFHRFPSADGRVALQAALYLPDEKTHGEGPWPVIVATYGGPHVQYVQNSWGMMSADMRSQFQRANGFAVIKVDNRGSNRRGLLFETPIYGNMGDLEVADQVAGVRWAIEEGHADGDRVSVLGWSYGGYMALKCLADRPDVFRAAVSGAPVTDWALYDTAYTERYMGLPQENPDGYARASALAKVKDVEGSLLLCHGLLDENVLFRQSAVLVNALIEHQKAYELVLFPSERHGPRRPQDRAFLEERILAFLQRSLGVWYE